MLSVSVHKDIGEYTEKVVGKLSARTLACTSGGLAAAVGAAAVVYFGFGIPVADATLPVMACSMPFWLAGFWRPKGLTAEKFVPLYLGHAFGDGKLAYSTGFTTEAKGLLETLAQKPDRRSRRKAKRKGAELHEPSKA
ncbi:PrgI family protein [Curtanaerobium respiraculi]|uniref:PrgI family protein n=1 Tax=Curtanaerobium respiraculi TaxID=2949669 RepID=UPI0024B39253|nr:PrgI family protein [Curtanaerobium respiraculi]